MICVTCLISKRRKSQTLKKIKHKAHFILSTTKHLERLSYIWFLHFLLNSKTIVHDIK